MGDLARDVLVIAKAYPPTVGGVETYSEQIACAYREEGRRVVVLTQCPDKIGASRRGRVALINVGESRSQVMVFLRFISVLRRLARKRRGLQRFCLAHATTWRSGVPMLFFPSRPPLVVTAHGREVQVVPTILRPIMKWVFGRAALCVGVSETALRAAPQSASRAVVAYNGLSYTREALCASKRKPVRGGFTTIEIYTFCRLVERKNVHGALRAVAILRRRGIQGFRYKIAGDGPMRETLEAIAKEEGIADCVEFLGRIPEERVVPLYLEADIFLHPQITANNGGDVEGFGLTIADAMSFGALVIAGKDGGPGDFIRHGVTGFLVDGSKTEAIADQLERAIVEPEEVAGVAQAGLVWALETLSWRKHTERILAALNGLS